MHKIKYYQQKFSTLNQYPQGSEEWYQSRKFSFGGSEIGSVLNQNKNKSFECLCQDKLKISEFQDLKDDATYWGKFFEPIAKTFIRNHYGTIYEFGSIPHPYYPISYSPDGVLLNSSKTDILLLEIKNPIRRSIKDEIPTYYIPQIQTGLQIFNCESALFCQFRFRRCKLSEPSLNMQFDRMYHKDFVKRSGYKSPKSFGYIYWKCDTTHLIDLSQFEVMIVELIKYIPKSINLFNPQLIISEEIDISKYTHGCILKWKLFDVQYKEIKAERHYLDKYEGLLWNKYKEYLSKINP